MDKSSGNASVHEAKKMLRVLTGEKLKYTVRINLPDGKVVEFQSPGIPKPRYFDEDRCLWLSDGEYSTSCWIMKWIDGSILLVEENPK